MRPRGVTASWSSELQALPAQRPFRQLSATLVGFGFFFLVGGTHPVLKGSSGFALRNYSWWGLRDPLGCRGPSPGQPHAPYTLDCLSAPFERPCVSAHLRSRAFLAISMMGCFFARKDKGGSPWDPCMPHGRFPSPPPLKEAVQQPKEQLKAWCACRSSVHRSPLRTVGP